MLCRLALKNNGVPTDPNVGIRINNQKYYSVRFDPENHSWYLKKDNGGACIAISNLALILGTFSLKLNQANGVAQSPGVTNKACEYIASQLRESNYWKRERVSLPACFPSNKLTHMHVFVTLPSVSITRTSSKSLGMILVGFSSMHSGSINLHSFFNSLSASLPPPIPLSCMNRRTTGASKLQSKRNINGRQVVLI